MQRLSAMNSYIETQIRRKIICDKHVQGLYSKISLRITEQINDGLYTLTVTPKWGDDEPDETIQVEIMREIMKLIIEDGYFSTFDENTMELHVDWSSPTEKEYLPGGKKFIESQREIEKALANQTISSNISIVPKDQPKGWTDEEIDEDIKISKACYDEKSN